MKCVCGSAIVKIVDVFACKLAFVCRGSVIEVDALHTLKH